MPIGTCDNCQRENVPVSHFNLSYCGDTTACFLCCGDDNPDPYGELDDMTIKIPNPFETLGRPNPFKPAPMPNPFDTLLAEIAEILESKSDATPLPQVEFIAPVAQRKEQRSSKPSVEGSNPSGRTSIREIRERFNERGGRIG